MTKSATDQFKDKDKYDKGGNYNDIETITIQTLDKNKLVFFN